MDSASISTALTPLPRADVGAGRAGADERPAPPPPSRRPQAWWLVALVLVGLLGWKTWRQVESDGTPLAAPPAPTAMSASRLTPDDFEAAEPEAVPLRPPRETRRLAIGTFQPAEGSGPRDSRVRTVEAELRRDLAAVGGLDVVRVEASDLATARAEALARGAGLLLLSRSTGTGDDLTLHPELWLAAEGHAFGKLPALPLAPLDELRLADLIDRVETAASEARRWWQAAAPQGESLIAPRLWPRAYLAQRFQALEDTSQIPISARAEAYEQILIEDPTMLGVKHALARNLAAMGDLGAAARVFAELLAARDALSPAEAIDVSYDEAVFAGDFARALPAAQARLALRPTSGAITPLVACLRALHRPRAASTALHAWWAAVREEFTVEQRVFPEIQLAATELEALVAEQRSEAALALLPEFRRQAGTLAAELQIALEGQVLVTAGREAELPALLERAAARSGRQGFDAAGLALAYAGMAQHAGRPAVARQLVGWAADYLAREPAAELARPERLATRLQLHLWQDDAAGALAILDDYEAEGGPFPLVDLVGWRALLLGAAGRTAEAAALSQGIARWDPRAALGRPYYWTARLAAQRGDRAAAVAALRQAVAGGLWWQELPTGLPLPGQVEPELAALRGWPAYEEIVRPQG